MTVQPPTLECPAEAEGPPSPEVLFKEARQRRRRRRLWAVGGLVLALVSVVAGYGSADNGDGNRLDRVGTARTGPLIHTTWRVAATAIWDHSVSGNYPGFGPSTMLTCAQSATYCYAIIQANGVAPNGTLTTPSRDIAQAALVSSVFRSTDEGVSWTQLSLPSDTWLSTPLSCPRPRHCIAGALLGASGSPAEGAHPGAAVVLTTANGGESWSEHPIPSGVGQVREIACTSALRCLALTWGHNLFRVDGLGPLSQPDEFFPTRVLVTSNGAKTWSPVHVPAVPRGDRYSFGSITCATSARCVVTGIRAHIEVHQGGYTPINRVAVVLSVRDAGHAAALETPNVPQVGPISCPGATACLMVTSSPVGRAKVYVSWDGGDSWEKVPERGLPDKWTWTRLECISAASCLVWTTGGGVATTDDGGHDWVVTSTVPSPPPGDRTGGITDVTCARSGRCLALQELFPPTAPTGPATVAVRILTNPTSMP